MLPVFFIPKDAHINGTHSWASPKSATLKAFSAILRNITEQRGSVMGNCAKFSNHNHPHFCPKNEEEIGNFQKPKLYRKKNGGMSNKNC